MTAEDVLLDLGRPGARVVVRLGAPFATVPVPGSGTEDWRHATVEVDAAPFVGTLEAVLTGPDIESARSAVVAFLARDLPEVVLGGGRGVEVRLGRRGPVVEVSVTPSGDDPWPLLRWLVVDAG